MKRISLITAAFAFAAVGFMCACVSVSPHKPQHTSDVLPDIGTKMPDGRVYAGLSMATGKPSYIAAAGGKMPDGTVYAGISPDSDKGLYTTPEDAPGVYTWSKAIEYCKTLSVSGHHDWRMPTIGELAVQFNNRADIGGFNESGQLKNASGYYWSSLQVGDDDAWGQRFNDGFHEDFSKNQDSSLRCVR
jgi:hypothetical protein